MLTKFFEIIDDIRANHPTVQASDIAIVFLENENSNYQLADILSIEIATRYRWPAIKGYEAKTNPKMLCLSVIEIILKVLSSLLLFQSPIKNR